MISQNKKIIMFASGVNISGTGSYDIYADANQAEDIGLAFNQYDSIDYIVNVKSITGGSGTMSFQECFNDASGADVWVEAATLNAGAVKQYIVTNRATGRATDVGSNPLLGEGGRKRIHITGTGSVTASNIDIYAVLTN